MEVNKINIKSGIYLVIDPAINESVLLEKLKVILTKNIAAVQVWDNFRKDQDIQTLLDNIVHLCKQHKTPIMINNRWEYLKTTELDGIHFDEIPENLDQIKNESHKPLIYGLTCENDLADVIWAAEKDFDYISFCAMFPSESAGDCEIVDPETVKAAAKIFKNRLFLSGGISPNNLKRLEDLKFDGVAVISGIMNAEHPEQAIDKYLESLNILK